MSPDPDRQAVYYAEEVALLHTIHGRPIDIKDLLHLADQLFSHDWWARYKIPVPEIEPTLSHDDSSEAVTYCNMTGGNVIRLAPLDISPWSLAHEAAHIAQFYLYNIERRPDLEMHGREFRACYLITTEILLGRAAATELQINFDRRISVRPEHQPGQPGWIVTVPPLDATLDPEGVGIFPAWRTEQLAKEVTTLQERLALANPPASHRLNGATVL
jgi:hypothetical protein